MRADRHRRYDRHLRAQRESDEAEPIAEVDAVALAPRPEHLMVAARIVEEDRAGAQHFFGRRCSGFDRARFGHDRPDAGQAEEERVEQCVDRLGLAALSPPCGEQDGDVGRHLAAGVVADDEEGAVLGQALEAAHLGPEPRDVPLEQRPDRVQERRDRATRRRPGPSRDAWTLRCSGRDAGHACGRLGASEAGGQPEGVFDRRRLAEPRRAHHLFERARDRVVRWPMGRG